MQVGDLVVRNPDVFSDIIPFEFISECGIILSIEDEDNIKVMWLGGSIKRGYSIYDLEVVCE